MLVIPCSFCGDRSESEFAFGGAVEPDRPDPAAVTDAEWVDYLTVVPNPRGCGEWLTIWRDPRTHDIVGGPDGA